jgi:hypothetical protein
MIQNCPEDNDKYFYSLVHQNWLKMANIQYIPDINDKVINKEDKNKDKKDNN